MKNPVTRYITVKPIIVLGALIVSTAANAASYDYTAHYSAIHRSSRTDAQIDAALQTDTAACDSAVGVQQATPSASYRSCMLQHGWKYNYVTRVKIQATRTPADPYFSSDAKVQSGHFIDHDNGMDCQNIGGAEICDPPKGTVHYFDPDQNLPCTRTGAMSICSNF